MAEPKDDYEVGYRKPPKHSQFKKGQSGNRRGRPRASPEKKPADDLRSMHERLGNEELEVAGEKMTMLELQYRALYRMAAKGNIQAMKLLTQQRAEAGCNQGEVNGGGVLVVPGMMPLEEWSISAAKQQQKFREKPDPENE